MVTAAVTAAGVALLLVSPDRTVAAAPLVAAGAGAGAAGAGADGATSPTLVEAGGSDGADDPADDDGSLAAPPEEEEDPEEDPDDPDAADSSAAAACFLVSNFCWTTSSMVLSNGFSESTTSRVSGWEAEVVEAGVLEAAAVRAEAGASCWGTALAAASGARPPMPPPITLPATSGGAPAIPASPGVRPAYPPSAASCCCWRRARWRALASSNCSSSRRLRCR